MNYYQQSIDGIICVKFLFIKDADADDDDDDAIVDFKSSIEVSYS